MPKDVLKYLNNINVDTRFVSLVDNKVYINNLRFSKFSKRKEKVFINRFPDFNVIRSKIFQKIYSRASKLLVKNIKPHQTIFILNGNGPLDFALYTVLEPYQRKYGIKIVKGDSMHEINNFPVDLVAKTLNLDDEVENILNNILNGEKIDLISAQECYWEDITNEEGTHKSIRLIYPLLNVPTSWIYSWLNIKSDNDSKDVLPRSLLNFLEEHVPDVRENIYKSALFVIENRIEN
ncbi:MAG: hypothetical protein ACP5C3_04285 [Methanomicrobiales archaeon]